MPRNDNAENPESISPAAENVKKDANLFATAMELPFVLFGAIAVGVLFGYFLDKWLHTKPIMMFVLGGLGFFAGVRDVLRRMPGSGDGNKRG
jgi:F0F1-type ATP synthase assembly protein I